MLDQSRPCQGHAIIPQGDLIGGGDSTVAEGLSTERAELEREMEKLRQVIRNLDHEKHDLQDENNVLRIEKERASDALEQAQLQVGTRVRMCGTGAFSRVLSSSVFLVKGLARSRCTMIHTIHSLQNKMDVNWYENQLQALENDALQLSVTSERYIQSRAHKQGTHIRTIEGAH